MLTGAHFFAESLIVILYPVIHSAADECDDADDENTEDHPTAMCGKVFNLDAGTDFRQDD